jgi:hypothetical protein
MGYSPKAIDAVFWQPYLVGPSQPHGYPSNMPTSHLVCYMSQPYQQVLTVPKGLARPIALLELIFSIDYRTV